MSNNLETAAQIIIPLLIIILMFKYLIPNYFTDLTKYRARANPYRLSNTYKFDENIVTGIMPLNTNEIFVTTANPRDDDYFELPKSTNMKGGAEFTYSFWLNKGDSTPTDLANRIILLRGLKNKEKVITNIGPVDENDPLIQNNIIIQDSGNKFYVTNNDVILVKCPLIAFGKDFNNFVVKFNTANNPENVANFDLTNLNLVGNNWCFYAFTFADYTNILGYRSGVRITLFINGKQMAISVVEKDALKLNEGPLYILPNIDDSTSKYSNVKGNIADIAYHNRALSSDEVAAIYTKGYSNTVWHTSKMTKAQKLEQQYRKISLYDETQDISYNNHML